jgi:hypothetical protein
VTVTYTTVSTYSQQTTTTTIALTTSTATATSSYASSTFYAACAADNLLWGVNYHEINLPTNVGGWYTLVNFQSAYDCCVYGLRGYYSGTAFDASTGYCSMAYTNPSGLACTASRKTFQFSTGCSGTSSWVVSNSDCGRGTWTGPKALSGVLESYAPRLPAQGSPFFDHATQEPIPASDAIPSEPQHPELKL